MVALKGLDATALEIELQFLPSARRHATKRSISSNRHCKSAGLLLAMPPTATIAMADLPTEETAAPPRVTPLELIKRSRFSPR